MKKSFGILAGLVLLILTTSRVTAAPLKTISKDPYIGMIAIDADTGQVILQDHPDATTYPASVVKLMTLMIVLDKVQAGELHFEDMVTATRDATIVGGSQVYLKENETFSVDDLLYAIMIRSANDAATALAIHAAGSTEQFVELMNKKTVELGMNSTIFRTVHGLPPDPNKVPSVPPDITCPRDIAILSRALLKYPDALRFTSAINRNFRPGPAMQAMQNHNPLLKTVPGCDGLKTGWYRKAGYSISVTVKRNDRRIIVVVMGSKLRDTRDATAKSLIAKTFAKLPSLPPPPPPAPIKVTPPPPPPPPPPASSLAHIPKWVYGVGIVAVLTILWGIGKIALRRPNSRDF